ncbi:poly polymerase protein [Seiridium cupressi]
MFEALIQATARPVQTETLSEVPERLTKYLPTEYNIADVFNGIVKLDDNGSFQYLRALQVCLSSSHLQNDISDNPEAVKEIAVYVARNILPVAPDSEDASAEWQSIAIKGEVGLRILKVLCELHKLVLDSKALLAITAYSSTQDSWTLSTSAATAQSILEKQFSTKEEKANFIISEVLTAFLRPLFSKSQPATVTASGRKAEFVENVRFAGSFNDPSDSELKPWKYAHVYAISIFEWAVLQADQELLSKHWHLFTPVLLTLLDEPQTDIKVRAMHIFSAFWEHCPPGQMAKVGLEEVFEQAIFPAVLYLPNLTPEDESIQILDAAYPSLFQIAGLPYPEARIGKSVKQPEFTSNQRKMLDKIVRQGILVGYHHANEHIRLTELFCKKTVAIVNGMGIFTVKHLKDIIPMISGIMTEPFGTKYPPALLAANELLQTIMRCCWPRISGYATEIVQMLTVCYLNIEDEDAFPSGSPSRQELKSALSSTAEILVTILRTGDNSLSEIISPLVEKEPLLKALFTPMKTRSADSQT